MIRNHKKPLTRTRGQARRNLPWSSTVPSSARPPIHYQRQRGRQRRVFYIVQHLHYLRTGNFVPTKRKLLECVQDEDKAVLELSVSLRNDDGYDFDRAFSLLFRWCQSALARI